MISKRSLVIVSMILMIGCGGAYLAFQSSSRPGDVAWVKAATEMRIDGSHEQRLSGEELEHFLKQFNSHQPSDAPRYDPLLLATGPQGAFTIGGREYQFEFSEEKVVGGAIVLSVDRGIRSIFLEGPPSQGFWDELLIATGDQEIEQDAAPNP